MLANFNRNKWTTVLSVIFAIPLLCPAANYYSDPVSGNMTNNGSASQPWSSLREIFEAGMIFNAGDVLFLMNGEHGQSYISQANTNYVSIRALPGHNPKLSTVLLGGGAAYWHFDGITFTHDGSGGTTTRNYMLSMTDKASHVKVENCTFYTVEDSTQWTKADWYAHAKDAVYLHGDHVAFNSNIIKNTYFALQVAGAYAEVRNNLIDNFGADAIRALSSHAVYENNVIRDAYIEDYDRNHDDAIQIYDADNIAGGVTEDIVFRNNIILTFADPITQAMIDDNLVGYSMQGIIVTDGYCRNLIVENNLVIGDHYHGITLAGPSHCRVQNNTVIKTPASVNPDTNAMPWVQFVVSKRGVQPANSSLRNNIASDLTPWSYADGVNITAENNLVVEPHSYDHYFTDPESFIFHLKPGSPAVDAGVRTNLSAFDIEGNPRLVGPAPDCGAYELQRSTNSNGHILHNPADANF